MFRYRKRSDELRARDGRRGQQGARAKPTFLPREWCGALPSRRKVSVWTLRYKEGHDRETLWAAAHRAVPRPWAMQSHSSSLVSWWCAAT